MQAPEFDHARRVGRERRERAMPENAAMSQNTTPKNTVFKNTVSKYTKYTVSGRSDVPYPLSRSARVFASNDQGEPEW